MESRLQGHVIIFGYHRMGYHILKKLKAINHPVLIVDFNPEIIRKLRAQGIDCVYGDVEDEEIFEHIRVEKASMVVSTIPHHEETVHLIQQVRRRGGKKVQVIVTAHSVDSALEYYKKGVEYVIMPHLLGGEYVAELILRHDSGSLTTYIKHHQEELKLLRTKKHSLYFD